MTPKFWVTPANKYLASKGVKYKFAVSTGQNFFGSDVFFFLNPISFFKNAIQRLKNPITLDDIYDVAEIEFVPRWAMAEASEVVFGIDGNIRKVTVLDKKKRVVNKFIQFQTVKSANEWAMEYQSKLNKFKAQINLTKIPRLHFENIIDIGCLGSTVQITSIYEIKLEIMLSLVP